MTGQESGPMLSPGFWLHHAALTWRAEMDTRLRPLGLTPPSSRCSPRRAGWSTSAARPPNSSYSGGWIIDRCGPRPARYDALWISGSFERSDRGGVGSGCRCRVSRESGGESLRWRRRPARRMLRWRPRSSPLRRHRPRRVRASRRIPPVRCRCMSRWRSARARLLPAQAQGRRAGAAGIGRKDHPDTLQTVSITAEATAPANRDTERRQHRFPTRHGRVDGLWIEHVGNDHLESIMVQRKPVRTPGDCGDLVSSGKCLFGEQAAGGAVGPEDGYTHDGCTFW